MQNKSTSIVIIALLIIIAAALIVIALKKPKANFVETAKDDVSINQYSNSDSGWVASSNFNLKYPQGVQVYETKTPYAEIRFNYDGAVISWGGQNSECMEFNDYGVFKPGVSTLACLNGNQARIGLENPRNTISQKALDMFGEFVVKNNTR